MSDRKTRWRPAWTQVVVSGLIMLLGVVSARELDRVDQDLRTMYTEHTLAAADLAHITADVMRYRATVVRALEAATTEGFEGALSSLPSQRARIEMALDRYAASSAMLGRQGVGEQETLRANLEAYFTAAERTIALLRRLRAARTPAEAAALRQEAEVHIRDTAGAKLVAVSMALDRLLETVAKVGKNMHDDGVIAIRETSAGLLVGSLLLALLNLWGLPGPRRPDREADAGLSQPKPDGGHDHGSLAG